MHLIATWLRMNKLWMSFVVCLHALKCISHKFPRRKHSQHQKTNTSPNNNMERFTHYFDKFLSASYSLFTIHVERISWQNYVHCVGTLTRCALSVERLKCHFLYGLCVWLLLQLLITFIGMSSIYCICFIFPCDCFVLRTHITTWMRQHKKRLDYYI